MAPATKDRKDRKIAAASDYVPGSSDGETWIRRFKDPTTQIRICPAERVNETGKTVYGSDAWPTTREHYEDAMGSFPCDASIGGSEEDCPGCQSSDTKVQQRRRQYYINAIDDQGEYRVFKMGAKLFKTFQAREQRMLGTDPDNKQPLSDRDYLINRMGKGLDTTYDPESGEKYSIDFDLDKLYDIDEILFDRYDNAVAIANGEEPGVGQDKPAAKADDDADEPAVARPAAKKAAAPAKKAAAKPEAEPEPKKDEPTGDDDYVDFLTDSDIDDAETADIKAYLEAKGVEFPARAPRSRLAGFAKEYLLNNPPY